MDFHKFNLCGVGEWQGDRHKQAVAYATAIFFEDRLLIAILIREYVTGNVASESI